MRLNRLASLVWCGLLLAAISFAGSGLATSDLAVADSSSRVSPRVVGGTDAPVGSWPSIVALVLTGESPLEGQRCGGTVIASRWILTAAHCVVEGTNTPVRPGRYYVLAGRHKLNGSGGEKIALDRVVVYPDYDPGSDTGDVAVLRLKHKTSVPIRPVVKPSQASSWEPGDAAFVAGWGSVVAQPPDGTCDDDPVSPLPPCPTPSYPNDLQQAELAVVSDLDCAAEYPGFFNSVAMVCAGDYPAGTKDACQGDSGGPLEVLAGSERVVIGVVSTGSGCAAANFMGIYSRVSTYRQWIGNYASRLSSTPGRVGFGGTRRGTGKTRVITLKGASSLPATIGSYRIRGRGFSRVATTCPTVIESGIQCKVSIRFRPRFRGRSRGSLAVRSRRGVTYRWIKLTGFGR